MPYKDSQKKHEWEHRHHSQRLARRRELRRIAAARSGAQPAIERIELNESNLLWILIIAGGLLAVTILSALQRQTSNAVTGSSTIK